MGEAGMGGFGGGFGVTLAELRHDPECCLQVRSLTATISVEQRFLSPESAARMGDGANAARGGMQWLQGQVCGTGGGRRAEMHPLRPNVKEGGVWGGWGCAARR